MINFTEGYENLVLDFNSHEIPTDHPGFYNHPNFLSVEAANPRFLNNYAALVATQPYTEEYLVHARGVITKASNIISEELKLNGRLGACVDISGILSKILEKEGIWNCGIKGSLIISFPPETQEENTYFWSIDHGDFVAGHAWIYAPPFAIVDVAVKQQPYSGRKAEYIPDINITEKAPIVDAEIEDIISPSVIADLRLHDVQYLNAVGSQVLDINKVFPSLLVKNMNGCSMKYCPVAFFAPDEPLEEMRNMEFDGKTPYQLYVEKFEGRF